MRTRFLHYMFGKLGIWLDSVVFRKYPEETNGTIIFRVFGVRPPQKVFGPNQKKERKPGTAVEQVGKALGPVGHILEVRTEVAKEMGGGRPCSCTKGTARTHKGGFPAQLNSGQSGALAAPGLRH